MVSASSPVPSGERSSTTSSDASGNAERMAAAIGSRFSRSLYVGRTTQTPRPAAMPTEGGAIGPSATDSDIPHACALEWLTFHGIAAIDEQLESRQACRIQCPVLVVRRLEQGHAHGPPGTELLRLAAEAAQAVRVEVRIVSEDTGTGRQQLVAQAEGRAEGVLLDVAAVGNAQHQHGLAIQRADPVLDHVDGEGAHALVDLARQRRHPQQRAAVERKCGKTRTQGP